MFVCYLAWGILCTLLTGNLRMTICLYISETKQLVVNMVSFNIKCNDIMTSFSYVWRHIMSLLTTLFQWRSIVTWYFKQDGLQRLTRCVVEHSPFESFDGVCRPLWRYRETLCRCMGTVFLCRIHTLRCQWNHTIYSGKPSRLSCATR